MRAYWEPYLASSSVPSSICSVYLQGELSRKKETQVLADLGSFLAFNVTGVTDLYVDGKLNFNEMLFAGNAVDFHPYVCF